MKLETLAVHGGFRYDPETHSVAVPIYQTTSFAFDDTQHAANLFDLKTPGNIYTRLMNPTTDILEKRVAAMEGGIGALALASGMSAIVNAIATIVSAGENIVSTATLYGGTYNLMTQTLPQFGIEVRLIPNGDLAAVAAAIDEKTKAIFCESIGNPFGNITDVKALADIAHAHGIPLMVDNTVPSPYLMRPIELGADIVIHALTKYLGGHGNSLGGLIVDSGKFDWTAHADRFPMLTQPDPSYRGLCFAEAFGAAAFIAKSRVGPLRNMGAALSPFNAFLILQGIETLPVRMDRICDNSLKIAAYLKGHPKVTWVNYAALPDHPDYPIVKRDMGGRASGVLSFGVKGGRKAGSQFIESLKLFLHLVNIGDARSLACHPATTTHGQLSPSELASAGVSEDMVRLSIGLEHIEDLMADLDQAFARI